MSRTDSSLTIHHLLPRFRGGSEDPKNKIIIPWGMHRAYHGIFDNSTPDEAIKKLIEYKKLYLKISKMFSGKSLEAALTTLDLCHFKVKEQYKILFNKKSIEEAIDFLESWKYGNRIISQKSVLYKDITKFEKERKKNRNKTNLIGGKNKLSRKQERRNKRRIGKNKLKEFV